MGTKHMVQIDFDQKGGKRITCTPHRLYVKKLDEVEWVCRQGVPFTLEFGWDSPLAEISYRARAGEPAAAPVPADAPEGMYEYLIALYDQTSGLIYTLDPDMIIRR